MKKGVPVKVNMFLKKSTVGLLAALLILVCGFLMIGTAYGRYQDTYNNLYTLTVRGANTFQIVGSDGASLSDSRWISEAGKISLDFQVSNQGNAIDSYFSLSLATTLGPQLEQATVSLKTTNLNGQEVIWQGAPTTFAEDNVLYHEMGPGNQYHFYDQNGNELCWNLAGGQTSAQTYTLVIEGTMEPGLVEIIVTEQMPQE